MIKLEPIHEGDSLFVQITVTDQATGSALDLTGATVEARAEKSGVDAVADCVITEAANGVFTASWAIDALEEGVWHINWRVTKGSERQTVQEASLTVHPSVFA